MRQFQKLIRFLKKEYPQYKVRVRRKKLPGCLLGECEWKPDGWFTIRIQPHLPEEVANHILVHEWAHVLAWDLPGDDHGRHWGRAYSKLYRQFMQFLEDDEAEQEALEEE
jgi:hypothetical protein